MSKITPSKIELVIIQASPFCNIDCRYCYLPNRRNRTVIDERTLARIFERLFASAHLADKVEILWHAGEPLSVGIPFYEKAAELLRRYNVRNIPVRQQIQTNATLITQEWCDFIKKHQIRIGVSIDGPEHLHDANRVTRSGKGTHERAMRGVKLLQANGIPVYNICVLTSESLGRPDEIWNFFIGNGITNLAFNIEEKEGANAQSSVRHASDVNRCRTFFRRLAELRKASGLNVTIRELDSMARRVFATGEPHSGLNQPLATLNFDCEGNISTFSPELLTVEHPKYKHFRFGNVFECGVDDILEGAQFQTAYGDIRRGVEKCRATCSYFSVCGGGEPGNKLSENGTFDSAETMHCRTHVQAVCDLVLENMEERLGIPALPAPAVTEERPSLVRRRFIPLELVSSV